MIAQGFGFTRDVLTERNNSAYCRLKNYLVDSNNKRGPVILVRNAANFGDLPICKNLNHPTWHNPGRINEQRKNTGTGRGV